LGEWGCPLGADVYSLVPICAAKKIIFLIDKIFRINRYEISAAKIFDSNGLDAINLILRDLFAAGWAANERTRVPPVSISTSIVAGWT
jgi:hypothetical protein